MHMPETRFPGSGNPSGSGKGRILQLLFPVGANLKHII